MGGGGTVVVMASPIAPLDYDEIRGTLTAEEWYGIVTAADDGLLGVCCAEISYLRDHLADFLRLPVSTSAARIAAAVLEGSHEFGPELAGFARLLVAKLETRSGDWRRFNEDDDASFEYFEACMTFARGTVDGPQPCGDDWHDEFNATISMLTEPMDVDQIIRLRESGKAALAAGAPPGALLAADACAIALFRAAANLAEKEV